MKGEGSSGYYRKNISIDDTQSIIVKLQQLRVFLVTDLEPCVIDNHQYIGGSLELS